MSRKLHQQLRQHHSSGEDVAPILIARKNACILLGGCHPSKCARLEKQGLLLPVRLNPRSEGSNVLYRTDNVMALVEGRIEEWLLEHAPEQLVQEKPKQIVRKRLGGG